MLWHMLDGHWREHLPDHPIGLLEYLVLFEVRDGLLVSSLASWCLVWVLDVMLAVIGLFWYLERRH